MTKISPGLASPGLLHTHVHERQDPIFREMDSVFSESCRGKSPMCIVLNRLAAREIRFWQHIHFSLFSFLIFSSHSTHIAIVDG